MQDTEPEALKDVEMVAKQLSAYFLENGLYEDVGASNSSDLVAPASASRQAIPTSGSLQVEKIHRHSQLFQYLDCRQCRSVSLRPSG